MNVKDLQQKITTSKWPRFFLVEIPFFLSIYFGFQWFQTRDLIDNGESIAPNITAVSLQGQQQPIIEPGKTNLIYFFAPWCGVCHASMPAIKSVAERNPQVSIKLVSLAYETPAEVKRFIGKHKLNVPVLLGDQHVQKQFKISAFPTYYIVDANGRVETSHTGWSNALGLNIKLQ